MNFANEMGQMFFVKTGALHHIENIENEEAEVVFEFRRKELKDFELSAIFSAMSDAVLGNTYGLPSSEFKKIPRSTEPKYIIQRKGKPEIPDTGGLPNPHKFDVESMQNGPESPAGSAKIARKDTWPILNDIFIWKRRHVLYRLKKGDIYVIPPAYPHQIKGDVGYRTSATALSRAVLMRKFPFTTMAPLIVGR
ncbi:putative oxalate decarboxylase oxdC [Amylocarpus encephaloides]|uniref:Oxalate decarboxylase oxdC n=1 Tax=Amylocarpus encephaloides TaxID=45428 RepID=A0A9P7YQH8_9HELO|nr:putative oxalate decarboxylase oxdC [Amylocarpus encephaloides]